MAQITLRWHQYTLDDWLLPDHLYADLMTRARANRGVSYGRDHQRNLLVTIYDDDAWLSVFNIIYADYILESHALSKTYELQARCELSTNN